MYSNNIPFTNEQLYDLTQHIPQPQFDFKFPEYEFRNPAENVESLLKEANNRLDSQTKELKSIRYENMKLNAQIDVLNRTIDSKNDELEELRVINLQLQQANKTLVENNRNYWIYTVIAGLIVSGVFFVLGLLV